MNAPAGISYVPHLVLLGLNMIWGGSYSAVKVALASLPPFALIAIRFWIGVLCLLPCLGRHAAADLRRSRRAGLLTGVALTVGYLLQTLGLAETSASMGGFLAALIVLLVALGGFLIYRTKFGMRSVGGLALGLAGMLLLCWPAGEPGTGTDTPRGILLQVGSSTAFAVHILLLSHFGRGAPAIAYCTWQLLCVAVVASAAALFDGDFAAAELARVSWSPALLGVLAYTGVLATGISITVQSKVQHRIPPLHLALLFATQPLFAALVGWAALGDRMGAMQLLGGGTIVAAVLLTSLDR
ncbi:MAG TPA: DMT family transporter [Planctomycetota bacterium]|nr:DMT family transporter [Planctomycetota bacterium]